MSTRKIINEFLILIKNWGNRKKITYNNKDYSFGWLYENTITLKNFFAEQDIKSFCSITLNSPLSILFYLSSWKNFSTYIPIHPRMSAAEIKKITKNHIIDYAFVEKSFVNDDLLKIFEEKRTKILQIGDPIKFIEELNPKKSEIIHKRKDKKPRTYHITSGSSTGMPNLFGHKIEEIIRYSYKRTQDLGLSSKDTILICLSLNHAYSFSYQLLPALVLGIEIVLLREFSARILALAIVNYKITSIALLPYMYELLLKEHGRIKIAKHYLRLPMVAGDQTRQDLLQHIEKKLRIKLCNGIGMTELFGYGQNITAQKGVNKISLFKGIKVKIKNKILFKKNISGEIFVNNKMSGYFNDGYLNTGDLGYLKNNFLFFTGRKKNIIIKNGSNISPEEIEIYLNKIDFIKNVVVIGKKDAFSGELVCACIITRVKIDKSTIRCDINKYLFSHFSKNAVIDLIYIFRNFPLTNMSKIDRNKLRKIINNEKSNFL